MSDSPKQVEDAIRRAARNRSYDLTLDENRFAVACKANHNANELGSIAEWYVDCYPNLQTALTKSYILALQANGSASREVYVLDCVQGQCCALHFL